MGDIRGVRCDHADEYDEEDCVREMFLGRGRFGAVYKAKLISKTNSEIDPTVVVKTNLSALTGVDSGDELGSFISLVSELKMMLLLKQQIGRASCRERV